MFSQCMDRWRSATSHALFSLKQLPYYVYNIGLYKFLVVFLLNVLIHFIQLRNRIFRLRRSGVDQLRPVLHHLLDQTWNKPPFKTHRTNDEHHKFNTQIRLIKSVFKILSQLSSLRFIITKSAANRTASKQKITFLLQLDQSPPRERPPDLQTFRHDGGRDQLVLRHLLVQLIVGGLVEQDLVVQLVADLSFGPLLQFYEWIFRGDSGEEAVGLPSSWPCLLRTPPFSFGSSAAASQTTSCPSWEATEKLGFSVLYEKWADFRGERGKSDSLNQFFATMELVSGVCYIMASATTWSITRKPNLTLFGKIFARTFNTTTIISTTQTTLGWS